MKKSHPRSRLPFSATVLLIAIWILPYGCKAPPAKKTSERASVNPATEPNLASDGLEADASWQVKTWGNPAHFIVIDDPSRKGNKLGRLAFIDGNRQKAVISLKYTRDLSAAKTLEFDVFNAAHGPVAIAIALKCGPDFDYFESKPIQIEPGKRKHCYVDITAGNFKAESTDWEYRASVDNLAETNTLLFLVYSDLPAGYVFLDNVQFVEK